MVQYFTIF